MRIAISGLSGCGNTTVARLVGETLGYPVSNYTFRDLARDLGIELQKLTGAARTDIFDLLVVVATIRAAQPPNVVIGNRLATWVCNADLNIWLDASLTARSTRISNREKRCLETTLSQTVMRDEENRRHFLALFCIDIDDHKHVDATIDTEMLDAQQVAANIVSLSRTARDRSWPGSAKQEGILALLEERLRVPRAVLMGASGDLSLKTLFERGCR
jgi:cytidylate kinase